MIKRVVFRKESKGRGCQGMMITCYDFLLHFGSLEKDRLFLFLEPLSYFVCVCVWEYAFRGQKRVGIRYTGTGLKMLVSCLTCALGTKLRSIC